MSNNNTRNVFKKIGRAGDDDEMELFINSSNTPQPKGINVITAINIENDMTPGTSRQHTQRLQNLQEMRREIDATRINIEANPAESQNVNIVDNQNIDDRQRTLNLIDMLREARHQFSRSQSLRDSQPLPNGDTRPHTRSWRENLFEVLSSPASPRAQTRFLRAIFTPTTNFRYDSLQTDILSPGDQFHVTFNHQNINNSEEEPRTSTINQINNDLGTYSSSVLRLSRQISRLADNSSINENYSSESQAPNIDTSININDAINGNIRRDINVPNSASNNGRQSERQNSVAGSTTASAADMIDDADANAMGEIIVKFVTDFIRYLPFIFIIFVKFIHDHLLGILDIMLLHSVVYQVNKSIKDQVAKLNQKSFAILMRDFILVTCVITCRFIWSNSTPDPFGLLINPPGATTTYNFLSTQMVGSMEKVNMGETLSLANEMPSSSATNTLDVITSVPETISLGTLLYYVAVNDLILKLMTQLIKIIVTMLPTKVIRYKSRARLYAMIENISQFYRAVVPITLCLRYLIKSYTGLEVISGVLFSSFYMGAKIFEMVQRGNSLKNAIVNFMRNMDYDRKPTRDELEAAGAVCPICHDAYTTPVILDCGHIFCDECVSTWFKREQTCPMCRAKVSEDPIWQDGVTTHFYQLC